MKCDVRVVACAAGAVMMAATANAWVPWTNGNGSADFFDWENGGSANGLYGDPTLVGGDTLVFFPSMFRAESIDGVPQTTWDTLEVDLIARAGFEFTEIIITEIGDYGITGTGSVDALGNLDVHELSNNQAVSEPLMTSPGFPLNAGAGQWDGSIDSDLTTLPEKWQLIHITLTNTLIAESDVGSTSFIQKDVVGSAVALTFVPTPGTMALLAFGGLVAVRRRR